MLNQVHKIDETERPDFEITVKKIYSTLESKDLESDLAKVYVQSEIQIKNLVNIIDIFRIRCFDEVQKKAHFFAQKRSTILRPFRCKVKVKEVDM